MNFYFWVTSFQQPQLQSVSLFPSLSIHAFLCISVLFIPSSIVFCGYFHVSLNLTTVAKLCFNFDKFPDTAPLSKWCSILEMLLFPAAFQGGSICLQKFYALRCLEFRKKEWRDDQRGEELSVDGHEKERQTVIRQDNAF